MTRLKAHTHTHTETYLTDTQRHRHTHLTDTNTSYSHTSQTYTSHTYKHLTDTHTPCRLRHAYLIDTYTHLADTHRGQNLSWIDRYTHLIDIHTSHYVTDTHSSQTHHFSNIHLTDFLPQIGTKISATWIHISNLTGTKCPHPNLLVHVQIFLEHLLCSRHCSSH